MMITSSPFLAAMRLGVKAIERRHGFEEAVQNLVRARHEEQLLRAAYLKARDESMTEE